MAQHRVRTDRQHRGQPVTLTRNDAMTDGENPAMEPMQSPGLRPMLDRSPAEPKRQELPARDHTVLALREGCHGHVNVAPPQFSPYIGDKCTRASHGASLARRLRRNQTEALRLSHRLVPCRHGTSPAPRCRRTPNPTALKRISRNCPSGRARCRTR
jgi:hypothetical protein